MQEEQLAYYTVRAPFDGVVGDIPVHVGDYVLRQSPNALLTTVDQNGDLEAYIYIPTERSSQAAHGARSGTVRHERQAAGENEDRLHVAAGGSELCRAFW